MSLTLLPKSLKGVKDLFDQGKPHVSQWTEFTMDKDFKGLADS